MKQKENSESTQFNDNKEQFLNVIHELKMKGTFSSAIEFGPDGEWLGLVYELDTNFSDLDEQIHFQLCVFDGEKRIVN